MKVSIVPAGQWGSALAVPFAENKHSVVLWYRDPEEYLHFKAYHTHPCFGETPLPENVSATEDPIEAISESDIIVIAASSQGVRNTAQLIAKHIPKNAVIVTITKGIEEGSLLRMSEIIQKYIPKHPIACLSGPSYAGEVFSRVPTVVTLASKQKSALTKIQKAISRDWFTTVLSNDPAGTEICGAYKNVIAIATGMAHGYGFSTNASAAIISKGVQELRELVKLAGGDEKTILGPAGVGDLFLTCWPRSRNFRFGVLLTRDKKAETHCTIEGESSVQPFLELADRHGLTLDLATVVEYGILGHRSTAQALLRLWES